MANLSVTSLGLINPFVIAASPATQGVFALLKSAAVKPGAVTMRNFGHPAGDGSIILPAAADLGNGKQALQSHALGARLDDFCVSLEDYCGAVSEARQKMPEEVKLWVSIGHFRDLITPGEDWRDKWVSEAVSVEQAGADAIELHFNTPGVAVAGSRMFDFYRLITTATKVIKKAVRIPVVVKLPVESCDPLRAMEAAHHGGADALGPTARWKGFVFDLDWKRSRATPGGGYGGSQALPVICYVVAEARLNGISQPMYAGGGVFSWEAAAKLIMAGSQCVQLGSLACCLGPSAVKNLITRFNDWMDEAGYADVESLRSEALELLTMPPETAANRQNLLSSAYQSAQPDGNLCSGCGLCAEVCWYDAISIRNGKAVKSGSCVGCGYCFDICPTGALDVPTGEILASSF